MKYLRKFNSIEEYNTFLDSAEYVVPNVCQIGTSAVRYNPIPIPLYVEAIEDLTVKLSRNAIQYSLDNNVWNDLAANTATPTIPAGNKVYFKANITSPVSTYGIGTFTISGKCNVGGNIMSMIYGDTSMFKGSLPSHAFSQLFQNASKIVYANELQLPSQASEQCYYYMFSGCTSLIKAPELPSMQLGRKGYAYMFKDCKSLVIAPKLPATALQMYCYQGMFYGCTSLTRAPELPATNLQQYSYNRMFENCTSLNYIKAMFTTTPDSWYSYTTSWVSGVAAAGTFVKNAAATWDVTGADGVPEGWTVETATE